MKVPTHLKHEPVFGVEDYNKIDGIYAGRGSNAPCLSIGIAQWNQRGSQDISVKVWRNNGSETNDYADGNWSRMSEELPIHRNLDLTILICEVMYMLKNNPSQKSINLQNQTVEIRKIFENEYLEDDLEILRQKLFYNEEGEIIHERLKALADVLKRLGY
jgi:hypothetical protein